MLTSEVTGTPPVQGSTMIVRRKPGTIPVTVRLDPLRYDRLKRLVQRFSTTGQTIIQTALDRSMMALERQRPQIENPDQRTLFNAVTTVEAIHKPLQDSFAFVRPEPTIALTYRATVPMHRWLHRRSIETGQTIQQIINDALKTARGPE